MLTPGGTTSGRHHEALNRIEAELRAVLVPYEDELETAEIYGMEVLRRPGAKAHDWFAGVQRAGTVVKFNFLPMHGHPELLAGCSPALLKRRTGASVLKFTDADEALFADTLIPDLERLVARGFDAYVADGRAATPAGKRSPRARPSKAQTPRSGRGAAR